LAALVCDWHQVRPVSSLPNSAYSEWELWARPRFSSIPCPSQRSQTSRCEAYPHTLRFISRSDTSRPSLQYRSIRIPSARCVPICPAIPHSFLIDGVDRRSPRPVGGIPLVVLRTWILCARSTHLELDARPAPENPHRRVNPKRTLPATHRTLSSSRYRCPRAAVQSRPLKRLTFPPQEYTCAGHCE